MIPQNANEAVIQNIAANANPENIEALDTNFQQLVESVNELKSAVNNLNERTPLSGLFSRVYPKLLAAALGAAIGATIGGIPLILEAIANGETDQIPKLDDFAADATKSVTWPTATGYTLNSATLNGSLQLGGQLNFDSSAT